MKAVSGTGRLNFGSKNVVIYVFLNVERIYAQVLKIDLYKTDDARIVTKYPIPASLVEKARKQEA